MAVTSKNTGKRLFPSWTELLQRAAERLKLENKVADSAYVSSAINIAPPDYLGAARHARQALGPLWYQFLKEQFNVPLDAVAETSLRLAKDVWSLGSSLVVTTNYDNVLRWACPDGRQVAIWDIEAPVEMAHLLQGRANPTIWHLHGQISNAANIILTPDGYSLLYPDDHNTETRYKAALATLRNQFVTRNFLFVGWSFADACFGLQLDDVVKIFAGASGPHYALVPKAQLSALTARKLPVDLVPFEDFGKPLEDLLAKMVDLARVDPTPLTPSNTLRDDAKPTNPQNYTFLIPYREKGAQVIGRENALKAVRKQLVEGRRTNIGHTAAFQGVGGLGKTQLAVEYCYRFKTEYPHGVIWLNADQDIDSQLINIAERAGWVPPNSINALKLLTAKQRLRSSSQCLLVFDNLISVDRIKDYLPEAHASPHILITSRLNHPGFEDVPLEILTPAESLNLLIQESGKTPKSAADWKAAQTVATTLEGLPLALELAGAYLRHRDVTWEQYLALFEKNLKEALPGKFLESFTQHEKDIYSTLKINEEVFAEEPRLKDVIDVLTWSASAPMGESLLSSVLGVPSHELTGALGLGVKLRILQKSPLGERYSLHRLLQHVRRAESSLSTKSWIANICRELATWFQSIKRDFADLPKFEAEIDHLRQWHQNSSKEAPVESVKLLWLQAYPLHHRGKNSEALLLIERALKLYDDLNLNDLRFKAQLLNDLGATQNLMKLYDQGAATSEKALKVRLEVLGEDHVETAMSLHNVAAALSRDRHFEKAAPLLEKAYNIWKKAYSADDVDVLMAQSTLTGTYFGLQKKEALELAERTLTQARTKFGEKHPLTATSYQQLGHILYAANDNRSLDCFTAALKLRRELLGEDNFFTIDSLHAVVANLCSKGLHGKAEALLKEYLTKLPETHPDYQELSKRKRTIFDGVFRPGFRIKKAKKR